MKICTLLHAMAVEAATFLGFLREVIPIIFYGAAESEVSLVDFLERL
jgi:hypothetical protein